MRWFKRHPAVAADTRIAIGNFTLNAQLASNSGRSVSVAGYIYSDDNEDELNRRLDLYQAVIERQRARSEIPELEAKRDQMIKGLCQAKEVLAELEEKNRETSLSSQERMTLKNLRVNIGKMNEEIDKGSEAIGEAKRKAGVG